MQTVGVIGLGNMGSGLAKNLIKAGFEVRGFDIDPARMAQLSQMGGVACGSPAEVGQGVQAVFIMVMNEHQARQAIFGSEDPVHGEGDGLLSTLEKGCAIIVSATIRPRQMRQIAHDLSDKGLHLIDSPVSGGKPGAQAGTLTLMIAASHEALEYARPALEAVSGTIHHVGTEIGMGQAVKACLQSLIGSIYSSTYEATVLAAKAGIPGQVLYDVFSTSGAGSGVSNTAISTVMNRTFQDTGSHIDTMHKDLLISLDFANDLGVPLFTASTAMQLFQAGRTRRPDGDNQVVALVSEEIVGVGLKK